MHRFFVAPELLRTERTALPPEVAHQVARVLRLRPGDRVALFCGDGREREAVLEDAGARSACVRLLDEREPAVELPCELHVAVATLKGEKLDWLVQKLTELGARRISFLRTERTVSCPDEQRWSGRLIRYQRIAREAAEQSARVRVPEILPPLTPADLLASEPEAVRLLLEPVATVSLAASVRPCPHRVLLLIGPEGGFTEDETAAARAAGALPVRLGARVLRSETAALAGAALIVAAAEGG